MLGRRSFSPGGLPMLETTLLRVACSRQNGIRRQRAEDEVRTRDLQLGRLSLYQLSYFRINNLKTWKIEKLEINPLYFLRVQFSETKSFLFGNFIFNFPIFQISELPRVQRGLWARMDSNHRTPKRTDLQSVVVGHLTTCPDGVLYPA